MNILRKNLARDYALTLSWRYAEMEFLGLPSLKDERVFRLEHVYVPLRLCHDWSDRFDRRKNLYIPKALQEHRHVIVLGDPGSGKSTLVKVLTYAFGEAGTNIYKRACGELIPIPIVLRDYQTREWQSYRDMLRSFIATLDEDIRDEITPEWLLEHMRRGQAILLIDGIDEVGRHEDRLRLRDDIIFPLLLECPESYALFTSRIVGYEEVPFDFTIVQVFESREDTEGTFELIRGGLSNNRFYVSPFDDDEIAQFITRWYQLREAIPHRQREGLNSLMRALEQNDRVKRLAHNPQLLTLIALIHRVTANLPSGRVELYDKIVEAYLETIQVYRKLGAFARLDEMKRWLAKVGWEMQERRDEEVRHRPSRRDDDLLISRAEINEWLTEVMSKGRGQEEASALATQFLNYVAMRSGLLVPIGPEKFTFTHLTFQEYFAAFELRGRVRRFESLAETCAELAAKPHWHETLTLLFEMLTEFSGAGDDLFDVIAARARVDAETRGGAAKLFSYLLLDEQSGLSEIKQREAVSLTLTTVCGAYDEGVIKDLQTLSAEQSGRLLRPWFTRRLSGIGGDDFEKYFYTNGAELMQDWSKQLLEWVSSPTYRKPTDLQVAEIVLIGALNEETYRLICPWAVEHLHLSLWLRRTSRAFGDAGGLTLAELYRKALYATPVDAPRHRLLTELSIALAITKSQLIRLVLAILSRTITPDASPAYYIGRSFREFDSNRRLYQTRDEVMDDILRRTINKASERVSPRDLAREFAFNLSEDGSGPVERQLAQALALESVAAELPPPVAMKDERLGILIASERALFMPDAAATNLTVELQNLAQAPDDWSRLLANSALLMLGEGTPKLCRDRNTLLAKAIERSAQFTFPVDMFVDNQEEEFCNQLPELFDLIFLQSSPNSWLRPEFFNPKRLESTYFLSPPREFFRLASKVLDPAGDTELAKWLES